MIGIYAYRGHVDGGVRGMNFSVHLGAICLFIRGRLLVYSLHQVGGSSIPSLGVTLEKVSVIVQAKIPITTYPTCRLSWSWWPAEMSWRGRIVG